MEGQKARLLYYLIASIVVSIFAIGELIIAALNNWNPIMLVVTAVLAIGAALAWRIYIAGSRRGT